MNTLASKLILLADLLEYPDALFEALLRRMPEIFGSGKWMNASGNEDKHPAASRFLTAMGAMDPEKREELYTATFEVTPACVPYVSIHLFGEENFKRGEFMAALQSRYEQTGFVSAGELPDHLSVLLKYAARADEAERRELVEFCLLRPLEQMIEKLSGENPYRSLLESVLETLNGAYPEITPAISPFEQMRHHRSTCNASEIGCGCKSGAHAALLPELSRL